MTKQNTPIHQSLLQECKARKPEWVSTTSFVNEMLAKGLATLDTHDTLKLSTDKERDNKKEGDIKACYYCNSYQNIHFMHDSS